MAALDFPNSPVNGQTYSAPNGAVYTWDGAVWKVSGVLSVGTAAGGDLSGAYPNPTVIKASTGLSVPAGQVNVVGPATGDEAQIVLGSATSKGRVGKLPGIDWYGNYYNSWWDGSAWHQDDAAKPSWRWYENADTWIVDRLAPGGAASNICNFDAGGKLFLTNGNVAGGPGPLQALLQLLGGTDGRVLLLSNNAWGPGDATKSSWVLYIDAVGDQVLFGRRAPNAAAGTINWPFTITGDGITHCTLADASVSGYKLQAGAATKHTSPPFANIPAGWASPGAAAWYAVVNVTANVVGNAVLLFYHGVIQYFGTGVIYLGFARDGNLITQIKTPTQPNSTGTQVWVDWVASGSHTYGLWLYASQGAAGTAADSAGYFMAVPFV
jgi:hypothetical protein